MDEFQEILQDFLVESFELVEKLDEDLVELENTPEDLELLNGIFRVAHTVKGASSFLNFDVLTHLTHHMEDVLNKARHGELIITPDIMDVDVAACVARLDKISGGDGDVPTPEVVQAPAVEAEPEKPEPVEEEAEVSSDDEPDYENMSDDDVEAEIERLLLQRQAEDKAKREAKIAAGESVPSAPPAPKEEKVEASAPPPPPPPPPAPTPAAPSNDNTPKAAAPAKKAPTVEQTIRVDVKRLDHLMNLIGELVLAKNRLIKINDDVEERYEGEEFLEELTQVVSIVSLVTTDLQIAVMKTRMLPIGKVFNKFPRMIRDLTRELNKKIELDISGEETELDKSIVEEIGDPLVHIIRIRDYST